MSVCEYCYIWFFCIKCVFNQSLLLDNAKRERADQSKAVVKRRISPVSHIRESYISQIPVSHNKLGENAEGR